MTERQLNKMMKRDRRRKGAQRIGALAGTMTCFAILGALYGGDMKKELAEAGAKAAEAGSKLKENVGELLKK